MPQTVIMAGGLGTRLGRLTARRPKSLVNIHGRPFLEYQIRLLREGGVHKVLLCVGHLGEQIKERFGTGCWLQVHTSTARKARTCWAPAERSSEPSLSWTSGSLSSGEISYLLLDYRKIWSAFLRAHGLGMMVVYKNANQRIPEVSWLSQRWPEPPPPQLEHSAMNATAAADRSFGVEQGDSGHDSGRKSSLQIGRLFRRLSRRGEVAAYETEQRFYEIGSVSGLEPRRLLRAALADEES